jgi:hypothetical protein
LSFCDYTILKNNYDFGFLINKLEDAFLYSSEMPQTSNGSGCSCYRCQPLGVPALYLSLDINYNYGGWNTIRIVGNDICMLSMIFVLSLMGKGVKSFDDTEIQNTTDHSTQYG